MHIHATATSALAAGHFCMQAFGVHMCGMVLVASWPALCI